MGHLEREEVAKQLAKEFGFELEFIGQTPAFFDRHGSGGYVNIEVTRALISREMRVRELTKALRYIHDAFDKDLQQGFHTNDKAFARDIAASALNAQGEKG